MRLGWEHLDLKTDIIYILESKSGKPREIPISSKLKELLLQLGPQRHGSVFKMPAVTLKRHFEQARSAAKIEDFRFHDLRHTFASHFVMSTGDLPALQKLLGHHSSAMTQRYAHLSTGHLRTGIQKLEKALGTISAQPPEIGRAQDLAHDVTPFPAPQRLQDPPNGAPMAPRWH